MTGTSIAASPKSQLKTLGTGSSVGITTQDGYTLGGRFFDVETPIATVVIHAATSVPSRFYAAFAEYLASCGFATLTYDYRGVGLSRQGGLKGFVADKVLWGEQDMSAAFEWVHACHPSVPRLVVGHSVGGHFHGLVARPEEIDAIFTYGSGYGSWVGMDAPYKYTVAFLWYVVVPIVTALVGYLPSKRLGFGEDIPTAAARQWARWGKRTDYFHEELAGREGFRQVSAPWLAIRSSDDPITSAKNAHGLHGCYPNAAVEERVLCPSALGKKSIGHLAFFRRENDDLWPAAADWLTQQAAGR